MFWLSPVISVLVGLDVVVDVVEDVVRVNHVLGALLVQALDGTVETTNLEFRDHVFSLYEGSIRGEEILAHRKKPDVLGLFL